MTLRMCRQAVRAKDGHVYVALTNLDAIVPATVSVQVEGLPLRTVQGQILTAPAITTHNTYAQPHAVAPEVFKGARVQGKALQVALPAHSIVMLELQ